MNTFASLNLVIFLITIIVNGALGALIVVRQHHNIRKPVYTSFLCAIFFIALWTLFNYLADTAQTHSAALLFTRATVPSAFFMFWFVYVFATFFPVCSTRFNKAAAGYFGFGIIVTLFSMTSAIIKDVTIDPAVGISGVENTVLFLPVVISYFAMLVQAIVCLYKKLHLSEITAVQKAQIRYTILGWALFLLAALAVSALLPLILGDARLSKLGPLSSIVMVGFTTYAIVKHRFLDIRIIVQRSIIYALLVALIIGVYVAVVQFFGYLLHTVTNMGNVLSAGITMLIGIRLERPLERFFQKVTDPIFFKHRYNYADALHRLSGLLYTSLDERAIISHSTQVFNELFKTDDVQFVLDPHAITTLTQDEQSFGFSVLAYPIIYDDKHVGVVRFGPKRSGDTYTKEDVQLVATFAVHLAISLGKAKLHAQVQQYSNQLEHLVEERTAEIKMLQESQKQSIVEISHGLQTPLAVIMAKLEAIEGKKVDDQNIQAVHSSLERISDFIRQLLRLARLESKLDELSMLPLDLVSLIEEQREYIEVMAAHGAVAVRMLAPKQAFINGDKKLITEMIMNLVANAIAYRRGRVKSFISLVIAIADNKVVITVEDNGIGIDHNALVHIFNRFYRVENPSSKSTGTGLGLAIVKEIVVRHGGTIDVTSTLGKGTTFTICFPTLTP